MRWPYSTSLKIFQMVNSYFTVEKTDLRSATERKRRGDCVKLELLVQV